MYRYSVVLAVLSMVGFDVWERPREVLKMVAGAGS